MSENNKWYVHSYGDDSIVDEHGEVDVGCSQTSETIYLEQLEQFPLYDVVGGILILQGINLPEDHSDVLAIGELPYERIRLKENPEAFAIALWMVGYFGSSKDYSKTISDRHIAITLRVSIDSVKVARKALHLYLNIKLVRKKDKKNKCYVALGFKYKGKDRSISIKSSRFNTPYEVALTPSTPFTDDDVFPPKGKVRKRNLVNITPVDSPPRATIEETLEKNNAPWFEFKATIQVDLCDEIISLINNYQVTPKQTLSHGSQYQKRRDVLHFISILQKYFPENHVNKYMTYIGDLLPDCDSIFWDNDSDKMFMPISYTELMDLFGNGHQKRRKQSIARVLKILVDDLKLVEAKQSPKSTGNKSYVVGVSPAMYRFTPLFVSLNNGSLKNITVEKTLKTRHEVLSLCSLDQGVFDIFESVSIERKWNTVTRNTQYRALVQFDVRKGILKESRPGSRVNTNVVALPKPFKNYVKIDGEDTCEIDIKTAHPMLIAHYISDPVKKKEWVEYISNNDIYIDLMKVVPIPKLVKESLSHDDLRDCFKNLLNAYLNGGGEIAFDEILELEVDFSEYVIKHYPILDEVTNLLMGTYSDEGKHNGTALVLQQLESLIIGSHYMTESEYLCISLHDGLLCKVEDADKLIESIEQRALSILGYEITVTKK